MLRSGKIRFRLDFIEGPEKSGPTRPISWGSRPQATCYRLLRRLKSELLKHTLSSTLSTCASSGIGQSAGFFEPEDLLILLEPHQRIHTLSHYYSKTL